MMRSGAFFLLLSLAPLTPAVAQPAPAAPSPPAAASALDPARIAAAERLVALIVPPEVMRRMLGFPMAGMDAVMDMTPEQLDLGPELGFSEADRHRPIREMMSRFDPHFRERLEIRGRVTMEVFAEIMESVQPEITHAMVEFYAGNLTLEELDASVAYYSTPAGRHFAEVAGNVLQDPAFTRLMTRIAPRFGQAMATVEERVRAATAHLPPPRPPTTDANRTRR
jgi:hypothetical protein